MQWLMFSSFSPQRDAKEFRQSSINSTMDMHSGANSKIRLHISNIPYEMKWQELKDLLREKGWCVESIKILHV